MRLCLLLIIRTIVEREVSSEVTVNPNLCRFYVVTCKTWVLVWQVLSPSWTGFVFSFGTVFETLRENKAAERSSFFSWKWRCPFPSQFTKFARFCFAPSTQNLSGVTPHWKAGYFVFQGERKKSCVRCGPNGLSSRESEKPDFTAWSERVDVVHFVSME